MRRRRLSREFKVEAVKLVKERGGSVAQAAPSARSRSDEAVGQQVKASFIASDRTYGARRVWRDLLADGVDCGLHRIERLMRLQALRDPDLQIARPCCAAQTYGQQRACNQYQLALRQRQRTEFDDPAKHQ